MRVQIVLTISNAKSLTILRLLDHLLDLLHLWFLVTGNLDGDVDSLFDLGYLQDYYGALVGIHLFLDFFLNN